MVEDVCTDCRENPCCCRKLETMDCACGGTLTGRRGDPEDVRYAVVAHNSTPLHQSWRARNR